MIKRRLGSALRARSYRSQCREITLRVITHNVMIVIRVQVFYRAVLTRFRVPHGDELPSRVLRSLGQTIGHAARLAAYLTAAWESRGADQAEYLADLARQVAVKIAAEMPPKGSPQACN